MITMVILIDLIGGVLIDLTGHYNRLAIYFNWFNCVYLNQFIGYHYNPLYQIVIYLASKTFIINKIWFISRITPSFYGWIKKRPKTGWSIRGCSEPPHFIIHTPCESRQGATKLIVRLSPTQYTLGLLPNAMIKDRRKSPPPPPGMIPSDNVFPNVMWNGANDEQI